MSSENLHEPTLSERAKDMHRAIVSLVEELEAIDWYGQRVEVLEDEELRAVLEHHRNEEIEHAMMNLEWIRRRSSSFDERMRTYLFQEGSIVKAERGAAVARPAVPDGSLGIRSLRS